MDAERKSWRVALVEGPGPTYHRSRGPGALREIRTCSRPQGSLAFIWPPIANALFAGTIRIREAYDMLHPSRKSCLCFSITMLFLFS